MKTSIPDGKGGWVEVEGDAHKGSMADQEKQAAAREAQFHTDAGGLTERLTRFAQVYATENGLQKEHVVFATALTTINMRESYPDGKERFDEIAARAWDYYEKNAPKGKG